MATQITEVTIPRLCSLTSCWRIATSSGQDAQGHPYGCCSPAHRTQILASRKAARIHHDARRVLRT
jgi:hypothetical protein